MIRQLYIYWDKGFDNAPALVKKCLETWKTKNPTWKVHELDDSNLEQFINISNFISNIKFKKISKAGYSDIIRIILLSKFGGLWVDSTTYCENPLDNWLDEYVKSEGFFAFDKPGPDRLISSWFLYAEKDNYLIKCWLEKVLNYWNNNESSKHYFWFHYLFGDLYKEDLEFKKKWDNVKKISANGPHFIQHKYFQLLNTDLSIDDIKSINNLDVPLHKFTYRYRDTNKNNIIKYILNK